MKKYFAKSIMFAAVLLAFADAAQAEIFTAYLSGTQEVPANASTAQGYTRVIVNPATGAFTFTVVFNNLSAAQTGAHIHTGARGVNGPIIVNFGTPGGTSGTITGSGTFTPAQLATVRAHGTYVNVHSSALPGGEIRGQLGVARSVDYDGDGRQDHSIMRAPVVAPPGVAQLTFHNRLSFTGQHSAATFGDNNTDVAAPGDYDGDGLGDIVVYRTLAGVGSQSTFYIMRSSDGVVQGVHWGLRGDIVCARDYDGDGKTDPAVFRRGATTGAQAFFYIKESTTGLQRSVPFGTTGNPTNAYDSPVPGDYDGDGKFDIAIYRFGMAPNNTFIVLRSSDGVITYTPFGNFQTDWIVPGDYDGDGKYDYAAVRTGAVGSSPLIWYILQSSTGTVTYTRFGLTSDTPFPRGPTQGDYDGDAKTDISVYRPGATTGAQSYFWTLRSLDQTVTATPWGVRLDIAVNAFDAR